VAAYTVGVGRTEYFDAKGHVEKCFVGGHLEYLAGDWLVVVVVVAVLFQKHLHLVVTRRMKVVPIEVTHKKALV